MVNSSSNGRTRANSTIAVPLCVGFILFSLLNQDRDFWPGGASSQSTGRTWTADVPSVSSEFQLHGRSWTAQRLEHEHAEVIYYLGCPVDHRHGYYSSAISVLVMLM